jgi:hypothetical protein
LIYKLLNKSGKFSSIEKPYSNNSPESLNYTDFGRSPGLRIVIYLPVLNEQWLKANNNHQFLAKLTVAGTASDLNRIPFSLGYTEV